MKRALGLLLFVPSLVSASPRDIDGDGYDDVVIDHRILVYGNATWPALDSRVQIAPRAGHSLIYAVEIVGDVDGDGYADVVFGDPDCGDIADDLPACGIGAIHLYRGGPKRLGAKFQTIKATTSNTMFGAQVVALGDVDGDKRADIAVVVPDGVIIYHGGAKGFERAAKLAATHVVALGDLDKDGKADFVDISPSIATIHYGDNRTAMLPLLPDDTFYGTAAHGDFNGDGYQDLALALHQDWKKNGASSNEVVVYPGGPKGFTTITSRISHDPPNADFGAVISVGDLDGDGRDDLVAASSCTRWSQGSCNGGTAWVHLGDSKGLSPVGLALSPRREHYGITANNLVSLGDSNGDRHPDFMYGAFVYRGGKGGVTNPKPPSL